MFLAIKRRLRPAFERVLRRVPVARAWFVLATERERRIRELVDERANAATASGGFLSSEMLAPRGGLFRLTANGPLGSSGDDLVMPFDQVMYPVVALHGCWEPETLQFLEERADPSAPYVVLDVGANVGLFARQVALRFPNIARMVCVEPEMSNFNALKYNLGRLLDGKSELWNVALADHDGPMDRWTSTET